MKLDHGPYCLKMCEDVSHLIIFSLSRTTWDENHKIMKLLDDPWDSSLGNKQIQLGKKWLTVCKWHLKKNDFVESFKKITLKMFVFLLVLVMVMQNKGQTITSTYDSDPVDQNMIDGLVQDCSNSSALALELLQPCTKPTIHASTCISELIWML